jgi:hypothetical protein
VSVAGTVATAAAIEAADHAARSPVSSHSSATEGKDQPLQGAKHIDLQDRLRNRVLGRASTETTHRFSAVPNVGSRSEDTGAYQDLGARGIDTVLEVKLLQVRLIALAEEDPPPLGFFMQAQTRLVQPSSATVLYRAELEYRGAPRSLSEWTADEHRLLFEELLRGCDSLADKIFDEVFLLHGASVESQSVGLQPKSPSISGADGISFVVIDGTQPILEWEGFPTVRDRERDSGWIARTQNVRYDVVIYRARRDAPAEVVYSQTGLPGHTHQVSEPLPARTRYFWTVRARFELDGQVRVTDWSVVDAQNVYPHGPVSRLPLVPSEFYFRFETP